MLRPIIGPIFGIFSHGRLISRYPRPLVWPWCQLDAPAGISTGGGIRLVFVRLLLTWLGEAVA